MYVPFCHSLGHHKYIWWYGQMGLIWTEEYWSSIPCTMLQSICLWLSLQRIRTYLFFEKYAIFNLEKYINELVLDVPNRQDTFVKSDVILNWIEMVTSIDQRWTWFILLIPYLCLLQTAFSNHPYMIDYKFERTGHTAQRGIKEGKIRNSEPTTKTKKIISWQEVSS